MVIRIVLNKKIISQLSPKPPFHFDGTMHVPLYFPTPDFEWRKGFFWQGINFNRKFIGIKMESKGSVDKPKIRLTIFSKEDISRKALENIKNELAWRLGSTRIFLIFTTGSRMISFLKSPLAILGE